MYPRLVNLIKKAIEDKKGDNVCVYNVKNKNPLCDYVIVCTALNGKNMNAIATSVEDTLEENDFKINHIEGRESNDWVLVDCDDAIIHIMSQSYRDYVKLDDLLKK